MSDAIFSLRKKHTHLGWGRLVLDQLGHKKMAHKSMATLFHFPPEILQIHALNAAQETDANSKDLDVTSFFESYTCGLS